MRKVKFTEPFFSGGHEHKTRDGRIVKGRLYRAKVYDDVPDDIELPPSAKVLEETKDGPLPIPKRNPIHDLDHERAAGEAEDDAFAKAEQVRKKRKPGRPKKYA